MLSVIGVGNCKCFTMSRTTLLELFFYFFCQIVHTFVIKYTQLLLNSLPFGVVWIRHPLLRNLRTLGAWGSSLLFSPSLKEGYLSDLLSSVSFTKFQTDLHCTTTGDGSSSTRHDSRVSVSWRMSEILLGISSFQSS